MTERGNKYDFRIGRQAPQPGDEIQSQTIRQPVIQIYQIKRLLLSSLISLVQGVHRDDMMIFPGQNNA